MQSICGVFFSDISDALFAAPCAHSATGVEALAFLTGSNVTGDLTLTELSPSGASTGYHPPADLMFLDIRMPGKSGACADVDVCVCVPACVPRRVCVCLRACHGGCVCVRACAWIICICRALPSVCFLRLPACVLLVCMHSHASVGIVSCLTMRSDGCHLCVGLEVMQEIGRHPPIPVIAMTGNVDRDSVEEYRYVLAFPHRLRICVPCTGNLSIVTIAWLTCAQVPRVCGLRRQAVR